MHIKAEASERHTLAITVDNEPGILARIAGLFTARGYNIESLTVSDVTADNAISRITIVTAGPPAVIEQIIAQLDRLVPVHKVLDLTRTSRARSRWSRSPEPAIIAARRCGSPASTRRRCSTRRPRALSSRLPAAPSGSTSSSS